MFPWDAMVNEIVQLQLVMGLAATEDKAPVLPKKPSAWRGIWAASWSGRASHSGVKKQCEFSVTKVDEGNAEYNQIRKYIKMLKVGTPKGAVMLKIQSEPVLAQEQERFKPLCKVSALEPFKEYFDKLERKEGTKDQLKNEMEEKSIDPDVLDMDRKAIVMIKRPSKACEPKVETDGASKKYEDEGMAKYFGMRKAGVPKDPVKHRMLRDGKPSELLDTLGPVNLLDPFKEYFDKLEPNKGNLERLKQEMEEKNIDPRVLDWDPDTIVQLTRAAKVSTKARANLKQRRKLYLPQNNLEAPKLSHGTLAQSEQKALDAKFVMKAAGLSKAKPKTIKKQRPDIVDTRSRQKVEQAFKALERNEQVGSDAATFIQKQLQEINVLSEDIVAAIKAALPYTNGAINEDLITAMVQVYDALEDQTEFETSLYEIWTTQNLGARFEALKFREEFEDAKAALMHRIGESVANCDTIDACSQLPYLFEAIIKLDAYSGDPQSNSGHMFKIADVGEKLATTAAPKVELPLKYSYMDALMFVAAQDFQKTKDAAQDMHLFTTTFALIAQRDIAQDIEPVYRDLGQRMNDLSNLGQFPFVEAMNRDFQAVKNAYEEAEAKYADIRLRLRQDESVHIFAALIDFKDYVKRSYDKLHTITPSNYAQARFNLNNLVVGEGHVQFSNTVCTLVKRTKTRWDLRIDQLNRKEDTRKSVGETWYIYDMGGALRVFDFDNPVDLPVVDSKNTEQLRDMPRGAELYLVRTTGKGKGYRCTKQQDLYFKGSDDTYLHVYENGKINKMTKEQYETART